VREAGIAYIIDLDFAALLIGIKAAQVSSDVAGGVQCGRPPSACIKSAVGTSKRNVGRSNAFEERWEAHRKHLAAQRLNSLTQAMDLADTHEVSLKVSFTRMLTGAAATRSHFCRYAHTHAYPGPAGRNGCWVQTYVARACAVTITSLTLTVITV
jgi:hypothetical protein